MGVGRFYIYDSSDSYLVKDQVPDYIEKGIVHLIDGNFTMYPQLRFYRYCITKYRTSHYWIAAIDGDEFIITQNQCSIPSILRYYEEYGGVALNWRVFGSSGHVDRPSGGVLQNYFKCFPNKHVKTIFNPKYANHCTNAHYFLYSRGKFSVDMDFKKVEGPFNPPQASLFEIMWINHYRLKSQADFLRTQNRGTADGPRVSRPNPFFREHDKLSTENCSFVKMPEMFAMDCPKEFIFPRNSSVWVSNLTVT